MRMKADKQKNKNKNKKLNIFINYDEKNVEYLVL